MMKRSLTAVSLWALSFVLSASLVAAENLRLSNETKTEDTRLRASGTLFNFKLSGNGFSGFGTEIDLEHAVSKNWNFDRGFGQAYSTSGGFQTLFTVINLGAWYAVTGSFVRQQEIWKSQGASFGDYTAKRTGGLRLGIATQQYFFTTSTAAVPYSGICLKAMYEFGWQGSYDLAIGADMATLANGKRAASSTILLASLIFPIN